MLAALRHFRENRRQKKRLHPSNKQKVHRTTFDKRKRTFNPKINYIEDVEYPSKLQRFVMVVSNPFWYNLILGITFVDAMAYMHSAIVCENRLLTSNYKYQLMFEIIVTVFKAADIFLAVCVDYVMKLEFHNEARRPIWVLVCEVIGAIPFYPPVPKVVIYGAHPIKLIRIMHHFLRMRVSLSCHVKQRVANFILALFICETVYAWILFHVSGSSPSWDTYMLLFETSSACILGKGGVVSNHHHYTDSIWLHEVPLACGVILVLFIFLKPTFCDIICLLTMQYESKFKYIFKVHFFESVMVRKYNCNSTTKQAILTYLRKFWEERAGCMNTPEMRHTLALVFPRALLMEMSLDVSYEMFRHSQLFRSLEIPVMRNLAIRIQNIIFMKGEYIYHKRALNDYMIYVQTGVIDVLSSENGETGIISLTCGTVLGESALFYPYKSSVNIRCQTVCQIFILSRSDFTMIARHYPMVYQGLLQIINSRMRIARNLYTAKRGQSNVLARTEQIVWLKAKLHEYMGSSIDMMEYHLMKNIYLRPYLASLLDNQDPLCHTLRFLDMLSIKKRVDMNVDLVFIRSKCIWILNYNSPIIKAWEIFIAILAVIMLFLQPYMVFTDYSHVLAVIVIAINFIFVVDLMVTLITPPDAKSTATTLSMIFGERFVSLGLYLDICSVFHFPLFGHVFPFAHEKWIFVFHVVKMWKIYRLMVKWQNRFKLNLLLQKYCVFVLFQCVYVYTLGYILKLDEIIDYPLDPVGIQISTGVGFKVRSGTLKRTILYAFVNTFAAVFEGLGIVTITTANYMKHIRTSRIYRTLNRLYALSKRQPDNQLFKRLNSYLNTQINDNSAFGTTYDIIRFFNLPIYYSERLTTHIYFSALVNLEFFRFVPRDIIKRVSSTASTYIYHQHSLITRYGTRYTVIYILVRGEARTVFGDKYYVTKPFAPLNLLEVLFDMPSVSSTVALTEVEVVSFHYDTFMKFLERYKMQASAMVNTIEKNRQVATFFLETILNGKQVVIKTLKREHQESFVTFSLKDVYEDSYEEFDYYAPFDKTIWGFLQQCLLRVTILPQGRFLFWWEVFRCVFAYITVLVFFIPPISLQSISHPFTFILVFLDFTAYLDIYVRLHVCYYDPNGLLVKHPLYTAKNYLKKAFVVDFLAAFPFYLLVHDSPQYKIILNILHIFQMYRLWGFKFHYFYTSYVFDYIFILLTIICPVNFITCAIFVLDCYDWQNEANAEISCKNFKKASPLGNYLTVSYFIMSTLTCSGTGSVVDLEDVSTMILHIISACSFVSTFVRIYVTAYLFGSYNKIYSGSHKMRDKIRRLITFLRKENIRPYLRKQFKIYYELKWRWLYRINPFCVLQYLNSALRRDTIHCLFGEHIQQYTMIEDNHNRLSTFYKNILFETDPVIIPKNGYILTINDVHSDIYFIHKGSVDVVAANGYVLDTIYDGAILGNLDDVQYTRQRVSFVTNTVTKLLHTNARNFHRVLSLYPVAKRSFNNIKNRKLYYIPSTYVEDEYQQAQWSWTEKELRAGYAKYKAYIILSWFHFVFPCCIGLTMELYQIATGEMYVGFLVTQYVFDLIHLVHQYLRFVTPYMTQEQEFVMHPLRIKAHSMGRKRLHYKLYFVNMPFDLPLLIALIVLHEDLVKWSILFSFLRLNRLSRWANIAAVYYNGTKKVASFSRTFKIFMLFLLLIYSSQIIATFIAFADYTYTYYLGKNESQIIREMPVEHLVGSRRGSWDARIILYGRYWFFSLLVHTFSHDNLYYPKEDLFEVLFIVIFLYVIVFESFVMVQYYEILMESTTLVKVVYAIRRYVNVYYNLLHAAYVLRERVEEAITHYYSVKSVADDYLLATDCPRYLREAAMMSIYGYLFQKHPYFNECHSDFLRQVASHMKCVAYPINGTIVSRMDCHDTLYFVHKGEVAAMKYENDCTSNAQYLYSKGDSFGYLQGFRNMQYQYTYRTVTFCEIIELEWSKCTYLLDFFPMTVRHMKKVAEEEVKHYIKRTGTRVRHRRKRI